VKISPVTTATTLAASPTVAGAGAYAGGSNDEASTSEPVAVTID
jgi:hypothetical protein